MAKLKVDLDVLEQTIRVYDQEIEDIERAKTTVQRALRDLRTSGWDSAAGKAWFSLLDDEWLKNIEFQIRTLKHLRDCLMIAKDEYRKVYDEQQRLQNYL